jgi:hypothetical protein
MAAPMQIIACRRRRGRLRWDRLALCLAALALCVGAWWLVLAAILRRL